MTDTLQHNLLNKKARSATPYTYQGEVEQWKATAKPDRFRRKGFMSEIFYTYCEFIFETSRNRLKNKLALSIN